MNGPEHYREAERLLLEANRVGHTDPGRADLYITAAAVHSNLALAAATALRGDGVYGLAPHEYDAWHKAAGEDPSKHEGGAA